MASPCPEDPPSPKASASAKGYGGTERRDRPGFSPVSCCLSHDVSKSPRFLLNFPAYLAQRARYAGKTSTLSASIASRRDTLQLVADSVGLCGAAGRVHSGFFLEEAATFGRGSSMNKGWHASHSFSERKRTAGLFKRPAVLSCHKWRMLRT
jgi:hypothetical protein